MRKLILLLAILAAAAANAAHAQVQLNTDIGVELTASPTTGLAPGQYIDFTLTVTNHGPELASVLIIDSSMFTNQIAGFITNPEECYLVGTIVDGIPPSSYVSWFVAGLPESPDFAVGQTSTCHFQMALSASAPPVWPFSFGVSTYDPDLNPANDVGVVTLRQAVHSVPLLSPLMYALVTLLLIAVAARHSRSRQQQGSRSRTRSVV